MYNMDFYYDAFPIDWTISYNINKEKRKIENIQDYYIELSNRYKDSVKFNFLDNMKAVDINGSIKKLEKWVIEACWNIVQNTKVEKIDNSNKKNKKNINFDISGSYNISITSENKKNKINKIKNNYTPNLFFDNTTI